MIAQGDKVQCPADRGDPAYSGIATHCGADIYQNANGVKYRWITVERKGGRKTIWPSNRLGEKIS